MGKPARKVKRWLSKSWAVLGISFFLTISLLLPWPVNALAPLAAASSTTYLTCPTGCECLTEAKAKEKFGVGRYEKCKEEICGTEQGPPTAAGPGALIPKYCFKAKPSCPENCVCLTEDEAKKLGSNLCRNERILCGYDKDQKPKYCYTLPPAGKCPPMCRCLTEAQAKDLGYNKFCRNEKVECGREADGTPKLCYEVPVQQCPSGCTCLAKDEAARLGLGEKDFCRDKNGQPIVCGVIDAERGEYKYCFKTPVQQECRYDYDKGMCIGSCPRGKLCQINTIYRDPKTGKVTYAECHCKAPPKMIIFNIGQRKYVVDGQVIEMDVAPFIKDGRTQIPVRFLAYALGLGENEVDWDPGAQRVILLRGNIRVELLIGRAVIIINGGERPIDIAPLIEQGRTFLPARFVAEAFGFNVKWDDQTRTVNILWQELLGQMIIDPARIKHLTQKVHGDFRQMVLVQKVPVSVALQQQKDFLLKQPEVKEVVEVAGGNLFVKFKDGYELLMLLGKDTLGSETASPGESKIALQTKLVLPPPDFKFLLPPCHPKSVKALIFDCLEDDANVVTPKVWQQVKSNLEARGYTVTAKLNNNASLSAAALIDDGEYGLVFMRGHGGVVGSDFGFLVRPWYENPPPMNSGYTGTIPASAYNHAAGEDQYGYVFTGQFTSTYWTNKSFPDTMFFLESCHGADPAGLSGMPAWTVNHGASAWLGWNGSVSFNCGDNGSKLFFEKIKAGKNITDALAAVTATGCHPPNLVVHPTNKGGCKLAAWYSDPNEGGISDGRDFKLLKLVPSTSFLYGDITFYGAPIFDEFFFYVDTTGDSAAEVLVRCRPNNFEVYQQTSPGWYNTKVFTGTPAISGNNYSLAIPWETFFAGAGSIKVWLYDMTGKDRLPDSGSVGIQK